MERAPFVSEDGEVVEALEGEMWIRSGDNVRDTADEIIGNIGATLQVNLACIGAAAVNQGMKSVAVARQTLDKEGYDLAVQPYFSNIVDDQNRKRTRIVLRVTMFRIA